MIVRKIISGGQTGVDIAAIDVAIELGIDWGGWVPKGRPQELGKKIPASYDRFAEHDSRDWLPRTHANVNDATATLILVSHRQYDRDGVLVGGSGRTLAYASGWKPARAKDIGEAGQPFPSDVEEVQDWLRRIKEPGCVLNVAGPRASKWPGGYEAARAFLRAVLK